MASTASTLLTASPAESTLPPESIRRQWGSENEIRAWEGCKCCRDRVILRKPCTSCGGFRFVPAQPTIPSLTSLSVLRGRKLLAPRVGVVRLRQVCGPLQHGRFLAAPAWKIHESLCLVFAVRALQLDGSGEGIGLVKLSWLKQAISRYTRPQIPTTNG